MKNSKLITAIASILVTAFTAWEIGSAINITHTTGLLQITSGDPSAVLVVSQLNHSAAYAGKGQASIRLRPGTYLVSGKDQGTTAMISVTITKEQTTYGNLNLANQIKQDAINNALIEKLPVIGPASEYTIDYYLVYSNGKSSPIITISSISAKAKEDALQWIGYQGLNPANYHIQYTTTQASNTGNYFVGGN